MTASDSDLEALAVLEDQEATAATKRAATIRGWKSGTTTPGRYIGLETNLDPYWNAVVFQDDLMTLTEDFFGTYSTWTSYAQHGTAYTTNADPAKGGDGSHYVTNTSKVRDLALADGITRRVLVGTLQTKSGTSDKTNHCVQYAPKFTFNGLPTSTLYDYCIQMAVGVQANAPKGWHKAGLWWVDDAPWATQGEDDIDECSYPYNCGGWFHNAGTGNLNNGRDQQQLSSTVSQQGQIHVIRAEFIHGQSFKWFVDGKLLKTVTGSQVSTHKRRLSLQYEPDGGATPAGNMDCYIDWIDVRTHA